MVGLLLVSSMIYSLVGITRDVPVLADIENLPVSVIDAGHGGMDGGAVGVDNIVEKDINLAICLTLRDQFEANGFRVVMTRETDISIHDEGITGARKQKTSDLHNRLALVNAQLNAIFISIHQNKFGESRSHGAQMFYSTNNPESERLATILQENFISQIQPENTRQIKKAGKDLYLMYNAQCPAVLIECGFLSNSTDAYRLIDPEYQNKIAFTTLGSVLKFLETPTTPNATLE
jgi:N-acetylmuramoyl-L-alanine amidase